MSVQMKMQPPDLNGVLLLLALAVASFSGSAHAAQNSAPPSPDTADWPGTPHIIQNSSKTVVWKWDHPAFGDNAPNQNPFSAGAFSYNVRVPPRYMDPEANSNSNITRDYNPVLKRYVESDPIGLTTGIK